MLKKNNLFGFEFISEDNIEVVVEDIIKVQSYTINNALPFLVTPNVDIIVQLTKPKNEYLKKYFVNSLYILPDGQPIIISSKLLGKNLKTRLTGSDLFPVLWNKSKTQGIKTLVLTSSSHVSKMLEKENLNAICYTLPFFKSSDSTEIERISTECVKIIIENEIKLVLIGISFPKQNILAVDIYNLLVKNEYQNFPLFATLGASFEFYLNLKKRAPILFQRTGFEWLYRFIKEPKRLFRRYFIDDPQFILIFLEELFHNNKEK